MSVVSPNQTLWQSASAGMSKEEIFSLFPNAVLQTDRESLVTGAVGEIGIPIYEIAGHNFHVKFYFLNDALTQVVITSPDLQDNNSKNKVLFDNLTDLLTARYGVPTESVNDCGEFLVTFSRDWLGDGVKVNLLYMNAGGFPVLNINYQPRLREDVEKL